LFVYYLQKNTGQNGGKPKLDLNVEAAWAQGVTGKNVTTAIMDDGEFSSFFSSYGTFPINSQSTLCFKPEKNGETGPSLHKAK